MLAALGTIVMIYTYYDIGWEGQPPIKNAEEGGYLHIYKGPITSKNAKGDEIIKNARARAAALDKLLWFAHHVKSESQRRG